MRILLWHGYLLTGSGANLYTRNIARAWRSIGHDVLLMCQERDLQDVDFVDEEGDFAPDNRSITWTSRIAEPASGRCRLLRPWIGEVLPVYVWDAYEGFTAKRFVDLTEEELDLYTTRNVEAMVAAIEEHRPDAILTGHEVMGPYIALQACTPTQTTYVAKLHGSPLEFAIKKQGRYQRYALEGLSGAAVVVGGSEYMVAEAASVVPGWSDRAVVVNPGCDVSLFRPRSRARAASPTVGFVGKLLASKGVHNLLAATGLVRRDDLKVVVVGFGGLADHLKALWDALHSGDVDAARALVDAVDEPGFAHLDAFLDRVGPGTLARYASIDLSFAGRVDHRPLAELLPAFDVLVVPSVLPEAFGMVAVEAAASGVLPVVPGHSGIGEIGAALQEELGTPGLLVYDPQRPIQGIAERIDAVLAMPSERRTPLESKAVELARSRWSWEHVAATLLHHATVH